MQFPSFYHPPIAMLQHSNNDDVSNANTDDSLLDSRTSSERTSSDNLDSIRCCQLDNDKKRVCSYLPWKLLLGLISIMAGIFSVIWTPFELLMNERIEMRPGLPPFEWWESPPDEVFLKAYLFNVTNSEEFLNGTADKMNYQEIGPITYLEKLYHKNVTFNENGTMTYTAERRAIFVPEMNTVDLNATIIVPNWALLGTASYLSETSFFIKLGYNLLLRTIKPEPFVRITIDQLLWNFTDPLLDATQKIAPFLVPINNLGILARVYTDFVNTVTVYIGSKYGHERFFSMDRYDGSEFLPNYGPVCNDKVVNSTEGVSYPQYLTKNSTLKYWRKTFCKNAELTYEHDSSKYGIHAYKYTLPNTTFDRTQPSELDCYKSWPELPNGLTDISRCHFNFPMATSFPHFLYGEDILRTYVTGLKPDVSSHESYVIVEPLTGIPLESCARSQNNIIVHELRGFHAMLNKFSDSVVPMFWLEYHQRGLPWYILGLLYFQVNLLPIGQRFLTAFLFIFGLILIYLYVKIRRKNQSLLLVNKTLRFEQELFLSKV